MLRRPEKVQKAREELNMEGLSALCLDLDAENGLLTSHLDSKSASDVEYHD
jgi:hypothetical protein